MEEDWQKFPAALENYEQMSEYIISAAEKAGIGGKRLLKLELGFEEVIINIIRYAYESGGDIFIRAADEGEFFILEIVDFGAAFNPLETNDARASDKSAIEQRQIGGLGIALMKKVFAGGIYTRENFLDRAANRLHLTFEKKERGK